MKYVGLPLEVEIDLKKNLIKRGDFSIDLPNSLCAKVQKYVKSKYGISMSIAKINSFRKVYMRDKFIKKHRLMERFADKMAKDYNNGIDIIDISKRYDFPPVAILRLILLKKGLSRVQIKKVTKDPQLLEGRDRDQFLIAIDNDYLADFEQEEIREAADSFERTIEQFFQKRHIPFRTQAELTRDQIQLINRAVITPDLYFPQGVIINGKKLHWIDAKNYYGGNASYVYGTISKQSDKYTKMYGSGGFIFKQGFSEALSQRVDALFMEWSQPEESSK